MPEYLTPGVYIEEIERGPRPIEGVPTSTAAFLGETERGPIKPTLVTSYQEYKRSFGAVFDRDKFMPYVVSGFFENGGKSLYVCRLVGTKAASSEAPFGDTFSIRASGPGGWGDRVWAKIMPGTTMKTDGKTSVGFRIRLAYFDAGDAVYDPFDPTNDAKQPRPSMTEDFDDLVTDDETSPDYYAKRFPFIDLAKPDLVQGPRNSSLGILVRKANAAANAAPDTKSQHLANGQDAALIDDDYDGAPKDTRTEFQGLKALELDPYRDVALVYAPVANSTVVNKVVSHCERMRFRFAAVDAPKSSVAGDLDPRTNLKLDSSYAAFYYPWIQVSDPATGAPKLVPPSGHTLGVYARTDTERGVFKAPANETVRGALALEYDINDEAQRTLNPRGVNAIRSFADRGIRIWGARTLTSNALWKYVSVRRLFIFLERSIYEGTQWVVFEPNDPRLWARVVDTIRIFLRGQWRLGALFGRTEDQAFFVTCDETTMTKDDILNGRLICEIGIAPVRPAEFVVFRIFQNTAEAQR
jgi:phage tail sheath protein FI